MLGVLLALHGSRDSTWATVAEGYRDYLGKYFQLVEVGYLEYNSPSLREALESLVQKGADEVVVVPLFISLGTHLRRDFPKALGLNEGYAEVNGKKIRVKIADPIGVDERVAEVLKDRALEAVKKP
jgi:sirohydrochlorin cobaltochelatase